MEGKGRNVISVLVKRISAREQSLRFPGSVVLGRRERVVSKALKFRRSRGLPSKLELIYEFTTSRCKSPSSFFLIFVLFLHVRSRVGPTLSGREFKKMVGFKAVDISRVIVEFPLDFNTCFQLLSDDCGPKLICHLSQQIMTI